MGLNLKSLLIRSDINPPQPANFGCKMCGGINCLLCGYLRTCTTVTSMATGITYPVRQSIDCTSRNVICVVSCRKCGKQEVGETANPKQRLRSYIDTARTGEAPSDNTECAIHSHFTEPGHGASDMEICLVEKVPAGRYRYAFLFMSALRERLEARWMKRLRASLNHNTQVWHLFSGYDAARGPPVRSNST